MMNLAGSTRSTVLRRAGSERSPRGFWLRLAVLAMAVGGMSDVAKAQTTLPDQPDARPPVRAASADEIASQLNDWLTARQFSPELQGQALAAWESTEASRPPLDRLVAAVALVDEKVQTLADCCAQGAAGVPLADDGWLLADEHPDWLTRNLRLFYGQRLATHRRYDELSRLITGLAPEDVADPAALLFLQAVSHHQALDREAGLAAIERLQRDVENPPKRYAALADLMRADLAGLEVDSLDHIARRMGDIERRLDLGQADRKVRQVEDGVIESLDKLIEKIEEQQQQNQQQQSASRGSMQARSPMQDSRLGTAKGAGQVDPKDVGDESGWGELPPKDREQALQQIGKDFPAHYRDVVEQYFRRLANDEESP